MRNCEQLGRSREFMLAPNLLPKAVPHDGSRLLLGLIVRPRGRLVEGRPSLDRASQARSSRPPFRERGPHPGFSAAQWPRFRSERDFWRFARAHLRAYFPGLCSQSQLNRRIRALEPELRLLQRAFARELAEPSAVYRVMDTTLVPAI